MDFRDFFEGKAFDAYEYFGAHPDGDGYVFRTYAPKARSVALYGDFNGWREQPMKPLFDSGIWTARVPGARPGQMYKYVIYADRRVEHCDPYGFGMEMRPHNCSVIRNLGEYRFDDGPWMARRSRGFEGPMNIYELHLGSWKRGERGFRGYADVAGELIAYLRAHGYNYVEFMPLSEHPFDGSWGYQNTGFFAPTARYGDAAGLMALVDRLHQAGIGAIMDFVPVHFAVDDYGLARYDGEALYEYPERDMGESEWGSYNFNHCRGEVASFLMSAANYWLREYHFDGLRMDAVSRLIYWQGDESRGENRETLAFLRRMNRGLHALHPTAMLIAEDSTAYPGVTKAVERGGLGFDYKWDLGWMHDTLKYLACPPDQRAEKRDQITFSMYYAYNERYLLPLSHDEVVHGKRTIIDKLHGDYDRKFSQLRLLYLYMLAHPGKKLNFMGNELAMFREWDEGREPDWQLLGYDTHRDFFDFITRLNELYLSEPPLWRWDYRREGFEWIDVGHPAAFAFLRRCETETLLILLNFADEAIKITLPAPGRLTLLLDTTAPEETSAGTLRAFEGKLYRVEGQ